MNEFIRDCFDDPANFDLRHLLRVAGGGEGESGGGGRRAWLSFIALLAPVPAFH